MPTVQIEEHGCRGCSLCVDLCPVEVFEQDGGAALAKVVHAENCIGCLTCAYACPSQCVDVGDYLRLRPFHRLEQHAALVRRFLQEQPVSATVADSDIEEAWSDVSARLFALSDTVVETIGKGYRAVARRAGAMAAEHLPEMYEAGSSGRGSSRPATALRARLHLRLHDRRTKRHPHLQALRALSRRRERRAASRRRSTLPDVPRVLGRTAVEFRRHALPLPGARSRKGLPDGARADRMTARTHD